MCLSLCVACCLWGVAELALDFAVLLLSTVAACQDLSQICDAEQWSVGWEDDEEIAVLSNIAAEDNFLQVQNCM